MSWDRAAALDEVSASLWRYLSRASRPEAIASSAERILDLQPGDVQRLVAAHLLASEATATMLSSVGEVLQRMPSSTRLVEQELVGRVHGPVDWNRTNQLHLSSGERTRFICLPPDRSYDSSLARLVAYVLSAVEKLHAFASVRGSEGDFGSRLAEVEMLRKRLAGHVKLDGVRPILPHLRELGALSRRRHAEPLIRFARVYVDAFQNLDPTTVRAVVEEQLLVPAADDALFELLVAFRLIDRLESYGYELRPAGLIEPGVSSPLATFRHGESRLRVWWQRSVLPLVDLDTGLYADSLQAAGMRRSSLRPDLILEFEKPDHVVLVEVKHTVLEQSPVHAGIKDALLYLMDAREHFDAQAWPHALVVAQGASTTLSDGRVLVCGGRHGEIEHAVDLIVGRVATRRR